jgi:hypothetical protein
MTVAEATPIDITNSPELARLAEEVRTARQPRALQKDGVTLAVVIPVASERATTRAPASAEAAVARLRATHGTVPPRRRPEDFRAMREGFEEGVAAEVAAGTA